MCAYVGHRHWSARCTCPTSLYFGGRANKNSAVCCVGVLFSALFTPFKRVHHSGNRVRHSTIGAAGSQILNLRTSQLPPRPPYPRVSCPCSSSVPNKNTQIKKQNISKSGEPAIDGFKTAPSCRKYKGSLSMDKTALHQLTRHAWSAVVAVLVLSSCNAAKLFKRRAAQRRWASREYHPQQQARRQWRW